MLTIISSKSSTEESKAIGDKLGIDWNKISLKEFCMGVETEMEHGACDPETDIIGIDKLLAGKIAWAHLKELSDYYTRLKKMEEK